MKLLELHFCEIKYDRKLGARGLVFQGCVVRGILAILGCTCALFVEVLSMLIIT